MVILIKLKTESSLISQEYIKNVNTYVPVHFEKIIYDFNILKVFSVLTCFQIQAQPLDQQILNKEVSKNVAFSSSEA